MKSTGIERAEEPWRSGNHEQNLGPYIGAHSNSGVVNTSLHLLLPPSHLRTPMLVILAILAATRASPFGLRSPPIVSQDQLQVTQPSCDDPNGCRSLGDIIRSCIITILLCTWVSMHPNIPSPDERWPRLALRRVGLMLLALFVPEAVIAWALKQRQAAAELAKEHKGES
jgi:hypothetical protein